MQNGIISITLQYLELFKGEQMNELYLIIVNQIQLIDRMI